MLVWILLGVLVLCLLVSWGSWRAIPWHSPGTAALARRLLDDATRLPLWQGPGAVQETPEPARPSLRSDGATEGPKVVTLVGSRPKKRLTQLAKKRIAARDKWRCQICQQLVSANYEIDHITPQGLGGTHDPSNLRTLCRGCRGSVAAQQRLGARCCPKTSSGIGGCPTTNS